MSTRTLDYGDNYPFSGVIGRTRHLAWPVHAYRITIPATLSAGRDLLNPFERVILNVIDAVGRLDEDALAQETCIPVDLVRTVILRLRDKGLINDDNLIIDRNRRSWEEEIREENYTSALAFRELVGEGSSPSYRFSMTETRSRRKWLIDLSQDGCLRIMRAAVLDLHRPKTSSPSSPR